jgi:hypothetical protein
MSVKRFKKQDLLYNVVKAYPKQSFYIYDGTIYESQLWPSSSLDVYSFLIKNSHNYNLSAVSQTQFNENYIYGDEITGSALLFVTSSLERKHYALNGAHPYITSSLRNTLDYYKIWSPHFAYSSSYGEKDKQEMSLIDISSMYYGSQIKPGTVDLKFFITGTLVAQAQDTGKNGVLTQIAPIASSGSGSIAGVCLYKEGFIVLTGSWNISPTTLDYNNDATPVTARWSRFGAGIESGFGSGILESASFSIDFKGQKEIPVLTMFCHANSGEFNHSNNPTYLAHGQDLTAFTSSRGYKEPRETEITNVVKTGYNDPTGSFEKITYISHVQIYDEDKNLLAVAKTAKPVKKKETRDLTYKLKLDI